VLNLIGHVLESSTEYSVIGKGLIGSILLLNNGARLLIGSPEKVRCARHQDAVCRGLRLGNPKGSYRMNKILKILVVDDEPSIRELLSRQLTRQGRKVLVANDGRTAIKTFRREQPDITILDLNMPDLDGIAVLKEIRTIDANATVMIFTGSGTEAAEAQARQLGVKEFLHKGELPEFLS